MTEIPHELILAYEATDFRVLEPQAFTLRVGQHSAELKSLYVELNVKCAGYLTAWNPFSKEASELENEYGRYILKVELRDAQNVEWDVDLDAKTGEVLKDKQDT